MCVSYKDFQGRLLALQHFTLFPLQARAIHAPWHGRHMQTQGRVERADSSNAIHRAVLAKHNGRGSMYDHSHGKSIILHLIFAHAAVIGFSGGSRERAVRRVRNSCHGPSKTQRPRQHVRPQPREIRNRAFEFCRPFPFLALMAGPERARCDMSEIHVHRAATQFSSITVAC